MQGWRSWMHLLCYLRIKTAVNHKQLNEFDICLSIIQAAPVSNSICSILILKTYERAEDIENWQLLTGYYHKSKALLAYFIFNFICIVTSGLGKYIFFLRAVKVSKTTCILWMQIMLQFLGSSLYLWDQRLLYTASYHSGSTGHFEKAPKWHFCCKDRAIRQ